MPNLEIILIIIVALSSFYFRDYFIQKVVKLTKEGKVKEVKNLSHKSLIVLGILCVFVGLIFIVPQKVVTESYTITSISDYPARQGNDTFIYTTKGTEFTIGHFSSDPNSINLSKLNQSIKNNNSLLKDVSFTYIKSFFGLFRNVSKIELSDGESFIFN